MFWHCLNPKSCPICLSSKPLHPILGLLKSSDHWVCAFRGIVGFCLFSHLKSFILQSVPGHGTYCPWTKSDLSLYKLIISGVWCSNRNLTNSWSLIKHWQASSEVYLVNLHIKHMENELPSPTTSLEFTTQALGGSEFTDSITAQVGHEIQLTPSERYHVSCLLQSMPATETGFLVQRNNFNESVMTVCCSPRLIRDLCLTPQCWCNEPKGMVLKA